MLKHRLDLFECEATERTRWTFVRLETADGLTGFGECSDAGRPEQVRAVFDEVAPLFATRAGTAADSEQIAEAARTALATDNDLLRRTVVGGIEQAFCDIAARRAGEPLWKWLGGADDTAISLYANVNRVVGPRRPEDVAAAGLAAVADGFATVKCAPFDVPLDGTPLAEAGLARVRALREAVGDDVRILVDCHERLPLTQLLPIVPDLETLGIAWLEDATACTDLPGLRALRQATTIPLAGGELVGTLEEIVPAVAERLLDVVMPDVKHAAGLLQTLHISRAVPSARVSPHNPSGPIATAVSAHLARALPNFTVLEYAHGEVPWRAEIVDGAEVVTDGLLQLPDGTGLGIDLATGHPALSHTAAWAVQPSSTVQESE